VKFPGSTRYGLPWGLGWHDDRYTLESCRLCGTAQSRQTGAEILQPLPEARKDGLSLKTELLTGPAEALSITDRAGCERRHFKISSAPGERASG
jgi:hypothetical protein